jgi:hypothetical protein
MQDFRKLKVWQKDGYLRQNRAATSCCCVNPGKHR